MTGSNQHSDLIARAEELARWIELDTDMLAPQDAERIRGLIEQLETTQRILIEERRWISDARAWYRDHRSSKGGIYDENTWGDPFAVPGEAEVPASSVSSVGRAERPATPPVSSPVSNPASERVVIDGVDVTDDVATRPGRVSDLT